jgi:hypothetical protein
MTGRGGGRGGGQPGFLYPAHLLPEQLQAGMKSGSIYRAKFRVNAGDRREAYCTIAGLPHDVLIKGELQQNRALEGDTVAVQIQGLNYWFVMAKLASGGGAAEGADGLIARIRAATIQDTPRFTGAGPSDAPWALQGSPEKAMEVINAIVQEQPAFRVTGARRRHSTAHHSRPAGGKAACGPGHSGPGAAWRAGRAGMAVSAGRLWPAPRMAALLHLAARGAPAYGPLLPPARLPTPQSSAQGPCLTPAARPLSPASLPAPGKVVAILDKSPKRERAAGFLTAAGGRPPPGAATCCRAQQRAAGRSNVLPGAATCCRAGPCRAAPAPPQPVFRPSSLCEQGPLRSPAPLQVTPRSCCRWTPRCRPCSCSRASSCQRRCSRRWPALRSRTGVWVCCVCVCVCGFRLTAGHATGRRCRGTEGVHIRTQAARAPARR